MSTPENTPTSDALLAQTEDSLLSVRDLKVHFAQGKRIFGSASSNVHAVDGVSFDIKRGTSFGLVGESGSGKTTTALAVMRLAPITDGNVALNGTDITRLKNEELREQRRQMQIIFQDPYSSLNPRVRAGAIVRSPLDQLEVGDDASRQERVDELFRLVGLRPEQQALFPHQFSGGQRQRIGVARALATQPELIVCDEPVSALDVAIQAQILNLLRRLQDDFGLAYLFISHDLGVVQYMCDDIAVMYLGQIVERADRINLFKDPLHPYTWALLSAVPTADRSVKSKIERIRLAGDPPSPINPPPGCRFASRCPFAVEQCTKETPPLRAVNDNHLIACHLVDENGVPPQRRHIVLKAFALTSLTILSSLQLSVALATETPGNPSAAINQSHISGAERAARQLIKTLGPQQTFAMLGWQQNPDYKPAQHCFVHWQDAKELNAQQTLDCEQHVKDLSRLYASYGVDAPPVVFKSAFYWDQKTRFDQLWPGLVKDWKVAGGREEDASYLQHPGCAKQKSTRQRLSRARKPMRIA